MMILHNGWFHFCSESVTIKIHDVSLILQPGYHLKQIGPNSFSCQKLSQVFVRIYSKDDAGELIPPVLLSLSGDAGYRNNSVSAAGGSFLFDNLFPGNFYLRPLLKVFLVDMNC